MTARDQWKALLKCPHCGKTGIAEISEDDGYIQGDPVDA
jgi:hypothetical protein